MVFVSIGVVAMHIETLEAVSRESKRLPPIQKVRNKKSMERSLDLIIYKINCILIF